VLELDIFVPERSPETAVLATPFVKAHVDGRLNDRFGFFAKPSP
jgi:hypothetical protein